MASVTYNLVKVYFVYLKIDMDECQVKNGGCDQICQNLPGTIHCRCRMGYTLHENGFTCDGMIILRQNMKYILCI